jgi:tape measure domain-containing protein
MSNTIDQRVVAMGFDNKKFESGVQTSLKSIDILKKALTFDNAIKGLTALATVANTFTLAGISDGIKGLSDRFGTLGVMGMTVINNITNALINMGRKALDAALDLKSIKGGFAEYEQGLTAFQTILANTASSGTTVNEINDALAELNKYANLTKFSFGDMTKAVGLFTAQGVKLGDSTTAIKGIFNAVALTGGSAEKANSLIYQLSQAIASGTVRAQDWISVVNSGIGGTDFQNQLIQTARVHGIAVDDMVKKEGSFKATLEKGWLSSEILLETLNQYTGDLTADQLKAMGSVAKSQTTAWGIFTKSQLDSLKLTDSALKSLGGTWEDQANALSGMSAKQLEAFGITKEQLAILGGAAASTSSKNGAYTDEEIKRIVELGKRAANSATQLKSYSQVMETLSSNLVTSWATSFKLIIGDLNEASGLWTAIGNGIGGILQEASDFRNNLLQGWKDLSGQRILVEGIMNLLDSLINIVNIVKGAFSSIFPAPTAYQLVLMTIAFKKFTEGLKFGSVVGLKLSRIFKGFFSIFAIVGKLIGAVASAFLGLTSSIMPSGTAILDFLANIGDYITGLSESITANNTFGKAIKKMGEYLGIAVKFIQDLIVKATPSITKFVADATVTFNKFIAIVAPIFESIKKFLTDTFANFNLKSFIDSVVLAVTTFKPLTFVIETAGKVFNWIKGILDGLGASFANIGNKISTFFGGFGKGVTDGITGMDPKPALSEFIKKVTDRLQNISFDDIKNIITTGLIAALILAVKNFFSKGAGAFSGISDLLSGVSGILDGVRGSLEAWQQSLKAKTLMTIATSIAILAGSLIALSFIPKEKLSNALGAITILFVGLVTAMNSLSNNDAKLGTIDTTTATIVALAASVALLSVAILILANIDQAKLDKGLKAVGTILAMLVVFMRVVKTDKPDPTALAGIVSLAGAIAILSGVVFALGMMPLVVLEQGIFGLLGILATLVLGVNLMESKIKSSAGTILALSISVGLLTGVVITLGLLDPFTLLKGIVGLLGVVSTLVLGIDLMGPKVKTSAGTILALAVAVGLLSGVVLLLGNMDQNKLFQGVLGLSSTLLALVMGLNLMQGTITGSAAMVVAALALAMLLPSIVILGSLPIDKLVLGVGALAAIFVVFGVAGLILGPVVPVLTALGVAVLLFGAGCAAAGIGILALSIGLLSLVGIGVIGIKGLEALFSGIAISIAKGIVLFVQTIADGAIPLAAAVVQILRVLMATLLLIVPELIATVLVLLAEMLNALVSAAPLIINAGLQIILLLLQGIASNIRGIIAVALEVVANFIQGIADSIPLLMAAGWSLLIKFLEGITETIPRVINVVADLIIAFITALAGESLRVIRAGFDLLITFLNGFADAIDKNMPLIKAAVERIVTAIIDGLTGGLATRTKDLVDAVRNLGNAALEALRNAIGGHSPSVKFMEIAHDMGQGLVNGIDDYTNSVRNVVENLGKETLVGLSSVISQISDSLDSNLDLNPTIRPVLNLDDIVAGGRSIDGLLGGKNINVGATASKLSSISSGMQTAMDTEVNFNQVPKASSVSFVQNNYSPKALSAIEVYRQTRNQLIQFKGLVAQK